MSLIGGYLYSVYYGMSINIQELGIKDTKINGIIFGSTQALGYGVVLPFADKMKRKLWTLIFQLVMLTGAIILFFLSFLDKTDTVLYLQTVVSSVFCGMGFSMLFPIFFLYLSELFPIDLRGSANSIILLMSNAISTVVPILASESQKLKLHFLVGCSVVCIISIPVNFCLKESLKAHD